MSTSHDTPPRKLPVQRTIPERPLGAFGENVSALGLGLGPLARAGAAAPWKETLGAALDAGFRSFDAAQRKERYDSEERLGDFLFDLRDEVFLSTRFTPLDGKAFDASAGAVRAQLEHSLRRLRTERIDLYHAHDVEVADAGKLLGETLPALIEARERGDIRYVGASGASLELLHEITVTFPVDAILSYARLDLVNADLLETVLPAAAERGIAVINASPLHMGVLGDPTITRDNVDDDDPLAVAARRAFDVAADRGMDLAKIALKFAASEPRVATTLVGCASAEEIRSNVAAFIEAPNEAERATIEEVRSVFGAM